MGRLFKSPWLEANVMLLVGILCFTGIALVSIGDEVPAGAMSGGAIFSWLLGFFLLSFVIAMVAVIGGIGGGVLFTPFMLAFTQVDSLIVRATGLIVAMFSGLVSTGPFMRRGLATARQPSLFDARNGIQEQGTRPHSYPPHCPFQPAAREPIGVGPLAGKSGEPIGAPGVLYLTNSTWPSM